MIENYGDSVRVRFESEDPFKPGDNVFVETLVDGVWKRFWSTDSISNNRGRSEAIAKALALRDNV